MFNRFFKFFWKNPPFALFFSFLISIFAGTILLILPWASASGNWTSFVDALFTGTTGVCVTGLIVLDTATYWSRFGQTVIMVLMQLGGLGIMTAVAFSALLIGKKLLSSREEAMKNILDSTSSAEMKKKLYSIVLAMLAIELIGSLLLFACWAREFPSLGTALFYSSFHSISAFCNAGLSLFSDSLIGFRGNLQIVLVFGSLIILGGLGFTVLRDFWGLTPFSKSQKGVKKRLNLHSKLVIVTTIILISLGALLFYSFEALNFKDLPWHEKILAPYFQSVTTRTAGFSTLNIGQLSSASKLLFMFLMFVGGGVGGTAGGIKVTTLALIVLMIWATFKGKENVEIFKRTIPWPTIKKAIVVASVSVMTVLVFSLILIHIENARFENVLFEVFSAFGTVGLSTGLTPTLSQAGKVLISILMLVGRIGPLALVLMLSKERGIPKKETPFLEEDVLVG